MRFEYHIPNIGFMDMFWPGRALVEMKAPSLGPTLEQAQPQAERYWRQSEAPDDSYDAVRYVVLCSFQRFLIWDMRRPSRPSANISLDELPDHYEALLFLLGENVESSFVEHHRELTREAAVKVAQVYQSLKDRAAAPLDEIQRFVLQCVWAMFAEDLGMLADYPFEHIVNRLRREDEPNAARDLGWLFTVLGQKGSQNRTGELAGTRYVNGELFERPASVGLTRVEIRMLCEAAEFDWRRVDPTIFGSLMEGVLGRDRRAELGAHYTHEADILKIVEPTIVRPWQERIDASSTPSAARELLDELCAFRVLDPACGCGNFLYVAYRELRSLEFQLKERIRNLAAEQGLREPPRPWPYVPVTNMQGIDIEQVSVLIARVTLWMGQRQMVDLYGEAEPPLPLVTLSGIHRDDALRVRWPQTDCIVGNPPFIGSQRVRAVLGAEYVEWLKTAFGVGIKDLCVYWFRRTQDHLLEGQRAGLVGTNSISQNRARSASLQYVLDQGGVITDAVSTQKWPGEARVHVSLVNWISGAFAGQPTLDGVPVASVDASLRVAGTAEPKVLPQNRGRCFQGPIPVGLGFVLDNEEAQRLFFDREVDYRRVVRPYMKGEDITDSPTQSASEWIIDFGLMSLEDAARFPEALAIVRMRVKPERDANSDSGFRRLWWRFGRPRPKMRTALAGHSRFIAVGEVGKRLQLARLPVNVCTNTKIHVFALEDDFAMAVLLGRPHGVWAWHRGGTLKADLAYTHTSVFETFPWPDGATIAQRNTAADACQKLLSHRSSICASRGIGLTELYNAVDDGAYVDLKHLHRALDEAVADCYGWPRSVAQDDAEIIIRLTELNRQISTGERDYDPFAYLRAETASS